MIKHFFLGIFSLLLMMSCDSSDDSSDDRISLTENEIPIEISTFKDTYFPTETIVQAYLNSDFSEYEIYLSNGFEIEFNQSFEITEIDGYSKIPDVLIPQAILNYVNTNYPNNEIFEWELEYNIQEVKLNNRIELLFSLSNDFIGVGSSND